MQTPSSSEGDQSSPTNPKIENQLKTWTESAFNVVKIGAILAAGVWTYYQWDRVVFPKESAEQFSRRVANRTDLEFSGGEIYLSMYAVQKSLQEKEGADTEPDELASVLVARPTSPAAAANSESASTIWAIYALGEIRIANQKNFPIELIVEQLEIRFGRLRPLDSAPADKTLISISIDWIEPHKFDLAKLFFGKPSRWIIESKGDISIPVNGVFIYPQKGKGFLAAEVLLRARAMAINPDTSEAVAASNKDKIFKEVLLLDPRNSDSPIVGSSRVDRTSRARSQMQMR